MSLVRSTVPVGMIATVILGVSAVTAFFAWTMWRAFRMVERAERDPKYLRRLLLVLPVLYACSTVFGVFEVATGREPIQALAGLLIVVVISWVYVRMALKVKVPPS
jgi:CDP-diglyceride synthetase